MLKGQLSVPYNEWDAGNGAAMRMAPVALFTLGDDGALRRCTLQQARLTHHHPLSDAACLAVGRMVQQGILDSDRHALHETTRGLVAELGVQPAFDDYQALLGGALILPAWGAFLRQRQWKTLALGMLLYSLGFLAGDWIDTGLPFCMESAVRSAALAAEAVLSARGMPRSLSLPVPSPQGLVGWTSRGG